MANKIEEIVVRAASDGTMVINRRETEPSWRQQIDEAIARARRILPESELPFRWAAVFLRKKSKSELIRPDECPNLHQDVQLRWEGCGKVRSVPGGTLGITNLSEDGDPSENSSITSLSFKGLVFGCQFAVEQKGGCISWETTKLLATNVFEFAIKLCRKIGAREIPPYICLGIQGARDAKLDFDGNIGPPFPDEEFRAECLARAYTAESAVDDVCFKLVYGFGLFPPEQVA